MLINANFDQRVVITPNEYRWVNSPVAGIERMMLDRIGDEVAQATTLVKYLPYTEFPTHTHGGGEEILVLSGEFADEHGTYPAGYYLRNPIGSKHAPKIGAQGATIFVKLHQFSEQDTTRKLINTHDADWQPGLVPGLQVLSLHEFETEHIALVRWAPNTVFKPHSHFGGEEIFVLEGTFYDEHGHYPQGTWIRNPHMSTHHPYTREDGALIYVKIGHLI